MGFLILLAPTTILAVVGGGVTLLLIFLALLYIINLFVAETAIKIVLSSRTEARRQASVFTVLVIIAVFVLGLILGQGLMRLP